MLKRSFGRWLIRARPYEYEQLSQTISYESGSRTNPRGVLLVPDIVYTHNLVPLDELDLGHRANGFYDMRGKGTGVAFEDGTVVDTIYTNDGVDPSGLKRIRSVCGLHEVDMVIYERGWEVRPKDDDVGVVADNPVSSCRRIVQRC